MQKLIASICVLAALAVAAAAPAAATKKPPVKSTISFTFAPPAPGQRSVTITGKVTGKKGCQAGRRGQIGALSGGSAPPTQPIAIRRDGTFTTLYAVSGPGTVEVFTALLPSPRKKRGRKITCGPSIFQTSIPFS